MRPVPVLCILLSRSLRVFERQVEAADGTRVVLLEPRLKTIGVVDVSTRHEHALRFELNAVAANRTARCLQLRPFLLAVLCFYFDDWEFIDSGFLCFLRSLSLLSLLFAHTADHLEQVIRSKVLIEVVHEVVWVELPILHLHAEELRATEDVHEVAQ